MRRRKGWFRRTAVTGGMLLFLGALVAGVMRLPRVYGHYSDERTLNRPEYTENEVSVYSYDYTSAEEKLQDMMHYQDREIELTSMLLPPAVDTEVSDGKLRAYMQEELDQLYDLGVLLAKIDLLQYVMGVRQLWSVYPGNGDRLKGRINYWEVVFYRLENMEESILILADMDYHKIYMLAMVGEAADRNCFALQNRVVKALKNSGISEAGLTEELLDSLTGGLADYYGGAAPEERELEAKDIIDLGITFRNIIKNSATGEWYLHLPVHIAIGEDPVILPVYSEYASDSSMLNIGISLNFVYPDG